MKWEPLLAMVALLALGLWIVIGPQVRHELRPDAQTARLTIGSLKGELEAARESDGRTTYRLLFRDAPPTGPFEADELSRILGPEGLAQAGQSLGNTAFRALNVTSWVGVAWIVLGFAGQGLFFGRMMIQWIVSERQKQSVVPEAFWWLSLAGGIALFAYFAWRQDIVGVLGQTSGVVIYARNIRLIHKRRRRQPAIETGASA
ncbi:MAG: lipid-A-disaccharide synthase N-terminal domain-containing protein [Phycisphaerales bacterium]|jgi:lipid-A-disaccharide synthase-like uncharacterized protein|nr:lipid-A-disaccharide synthase N-terminal domain-containing protein [Phycisphaeraceae bacterium]